MLFLKLNDSPRKNGRIHGETFRTQVRELSQIRGGLIRKYMPSFNDGQLRELALEQVEILKKHADLFDEFLGISEGAGIDLADLTILNNFTDMRDFEKSDEGCSVFSTGSLSGQTWDMHASAQPYMLHLTIEQEDLKIQVLTLTGNMALAGVNSHNLGIFINNLHSYETRMGLQWPALVRLMLLQKDAAGAARTLQTHMPCSGHNYLICDGQAVVDIETTGTRWAEVHRGTRADTFFHTNHYMGALAETEVMEMQSKSTHKRWQALSTYFQKQPKPSYEDLAKDLLSHDSGKTVCVPASRDPHASATCGGILLDMKARQGEVFTGFYDNQDRRRIQW